jgi:hypothetical protein
MLGIFSVSLGVLLALSFAVLVLYFYLKDITQKKHTILRNYPLSAACAIFSSSSANISASTFSSATATSGPSTARRAAGSIAWPRTKAACWVSARPTTCMSRAR